MSAHPELAETLPTFVSSAHATSPFFYFHHTVDPLTGTLTVEVLGPNLSFRFSHRRLTRLLPSRQIIRALGSKAVGFLALVAPDGKRVVLAAAESGHGMGRWGDVLDARPGVLANKIWTRRVVQVGNILGMKMHRPFDGAGRGGGPVLEEHRGIFQGSHVEVKLAVHGIFVLLDLYGITGDFNNVTKAHLQRLRAAATEPGGRRPVLEVYFSRKNCHPCGDLVRRLAELTGVTIRLCWKHRLEMKQYAKSCRKHIPAGAPAAEAQDEQDLDVDDEMDTEDISDSSATEEQDVVMIERVDLTDRAASVLASSREHVDDPFPSIDLTHTSHSPSPPPPRAPSEADPTRDVDAFLDGLGYRTGQMASEPVGATAAIVQFAESLRNRSIRWAARGLTLDGRNIAKPLPPTPVTDDPFVLTAEDAGAGAGSGRLSLRMPSPHASPPERPPAASPLARLGSASSRRAADVGLSRGSLRRSVSTAASRRLGARKSSSAPMAAVRERSPRMYAMPGRERMDLGR